MWREAVKVGRNEELGWVRAGWNDMEEAVVDEVEAADDCE